MRAGRLVGALPPLRQAASLQPGNAAIHHDLGLVCLRLGKLSEAIAAFEAALSANPGFALAWLRLGMALQAHGKEAAAIQAYCRATAMQPALVEAGYRLGALLDTLGRRGEALDAFRGAAAASPETSFGRLSRARALLAEDRDDEAESALRQLLASQPDNAVARDMLGTVLSNAGRFDKARECYERAIAAAPSLCGSYYELVRCRRVTTDDAELLRRMRAALATPGLHGETRLKLHLALGKAADDLDEPALAMTHFDAADTLRSSLGAFDPAEFVGRIDRLIASFTPATIARAAETGSADPTPVLIVGLPRSGTTLIEQILSCHPDLHAAGELGFWTERGAACEPGGAASAEAAADYSRLLRALAPDAARVTDKMPLNLFWAGLIHTALPRATIIHCRRHPLDTALSIHRTYFNHHAALPTGGAALVAAVRAARRLGEHWSAVLPSDRFVEIDYEALVSYPEPTIRRLVAACGLAWNQACLAPEHNARVIKTPSKWQARQRISASRVAVWRRYEPWLGPLGALQI